MTQSTEFGRKIVFLRGWLHGRGYDKALMALEYARQKHTGTRKDGQTPEFQHQVEIALHLSVLPGLMHPEETIATGILHDTVEDTPTTIREIEHLFGEMVAAATDRMTKLDEAGEKRDEDALFAAMAQCPIASLGKPTDRAHNQRTMGGVFTLEKMVSYVDFTDQRIIPMMKQARQLFPQQYPAYMLLKTELTSQARLVRTMAKAAAG